MRSSSRFWTYQFRTKSPNLKMRSFPTAVLAVLLSALSYCISAHPYTFDSRAEPNTIHVPIEDLLVGSTVVSSETASQDTDLFDVPATSKRSPIGNPCANEPCCTKLGMGNYHTKRYRWTNKNATQSLGATRRISEAICPPGSVTNSRTISYSYSVSIMVGPDLKFDSGILSNFGIRASFAYTWG